MVKGLLAWALKIYVQNNSEQLSAMTLQDKSVGITKMQEIAGIRTRYGRA